MLVSLFKKYYRTLFKLLSYHPHILWLFLLLLLCGQKGSDGKPTKWNHSIQRRFMWKQMDSTVNELMGRVVTGARVMKSMIGDFMPAKQTTLNLDFLPTETTRIKYIIRNPHTKETKVIRVIPSKKVVKLMAVTPRPLLLDKPIYIDDPKYVPLKNKSMHNEPDELTDKLKSVYLIDPDKLRQLEKEQELIAEGRPPVKNETKPIYITYKAKSTKHFDDMFRADQTGGSSIQELNDTWKPVYQWFGKPFGFSTHKPYLMSPLHTSTVGEQLPEPQKQIYDPVTSNNFPEEEPKKYHAYEVTEYTAEESIEQPYINKNRNYQNQSTSLFSQTEGSTYYLPSVTTVIPNILTQLEHISPSKTYDSEYRSEREYLPAAGENYRLKKTSTTTLSMIATTTTEEPNYPPIFLKKLRNRSFSNYSLNEQQDSKPPGNIWIPSNTSHTSQSTEQSSYHHHLAALIRSPKNKFQKWPQESKDNYLNLKSSLTHDKYNTTELPVLLDSTTRFDFVGNKSQKNLLLNIPPHSFSTQTKKRFDKHRGSVKYGDKLK